MGETSHSVNFPSSLKPVEWELEEIHVDEDDFDVLLKPPVQEEINRAEILVTRIMNRADWLWRQAHIENLHIKKGHDEKESMDGYKNTIVMPSAYFRNGDEDSLSLFQIREKIRAKELKLLQAEADIFLIFLSAEERDVKEKTRPVALIKKQLLENSIKHDILSLLPKGITITDGGKDKNCMGCHWDLHLTEENLKEEKLTILYGVLAQSSIPYRNNHINCNLANKNRKA